MSVSPPREDNCVYILYRDYLEKYIMRNMTDRYMKVSSSLSFVIVCSRVFSMMCRFSLLHFAPVGPEAEVQHSDRADRAARESPPVGSIVILIRHLL